MKVFLLKLSALVVGTLIILVQAWGQAAGGGNLLEHLRSTDPQIRVQAAQALSKIGPEKLREVLPFIVDATRDDVVAVRRQALNILWQGAISGTSGHATVSSVLPALLERFKDSDPTMRADAVRVVSLVAVGKSAQVIGPLTALSQDVDIGVRVAALQGLGDIGPGVPQVKEILVQRLKTDPSPQARGAAARSLRYGGGDVTSLGALILALSDADQFVRSQTVSSLAFLGPFAAEALPKLEVLAQDPSESVQIKEDVYYALRSIRSNR